MANREKYGISFNNHIFINMLPVVLYKPELIEKLIERFQKNHFLKLKELRVSEVEIKILIKASQKDKPTCWRFICSNTTNFQLDIHIYREILNNNGKLIYQGLFYNNIRILWK
jgi:hypothetical protein